ncbi:hypothetical protein OB2597_04013 [Pseudooceanicola batsensis HTCC2597]|uniref:Glycosyltransferase 2-like domain-containing protein n=1 Tax=Pseudooceanicola batsensis (strain ATCC BAA-863 / DSM 15984 / KCTC 12145 / HTCC2597) TaxID=252305 RepID=A3U2J9_PSEBH|nr:glycosyltransferase family A protein [Pseudooceanicola batsensis]EAQ01573.1 hypothetical protein OB2597_04013 [Pseudooceanicola batsensis HTCC2597]
MARPTLTLAITSYNRPDRLASALRSVVRQRAIDKVIVVDDCSDPPLRLRHVPADVRLILHESNRGVSAARNSAIEAARTSHIAFLDDDDKLLPWAALAWKRWLSDAADPDTIVAGSLLVGPPGRLPRARRTPPTTGRGVIWGLDAKPAGRSFATKQAAALPVALLRRVGGFDTALRSRVTSELFFRLTAEAPVVGHRLPVYWLNRGEHRRITTDPERREQSVDYIRRKHGRLFDNPARRDAFESNHAEMTARISGEAKTSR